MKKLRYKTKKEPDISLDEIPAGFTATHSFEYEVKKGKVKLNKKKLSNKDIKKLKDEREDS